MPTGKNKVPMAQLREVLSDAGYQNARTYIASGNVLVTSGRSAGSIEKHVHELILKHIGPDLTVIVRTAADLQKALDETPFGKSYDQSRVFYVFFAEPPAPKLVQELLAADYGDDELAITKRAAYLYIPDNYARAKVNAAYLEKKLGIRMTARNLNTITKLIELAQT